MKRNNRSQDHRNLTSGYAEGATLDAVRGLPLRADVGQLLAHEKNASFVRLIALSIALVVASSTTCAFAIEPERSGQESSLIRAVFTGGQLWALSDAGELFRITEGKHTPVEERLSEPALDLCLLGGRPAVITCKRGSCASWTLRRWFSGKWSVETTLQAASDEFIALSCDQDTAAVLTSRRLIKLDSTAPQTVALSERIQTGPVTSVHVTNNHAFVGINAGEWGGGLRRIDRRTGKVSVVERNLTGELCGGPLNSGCDPVNAIASQPGRPDCVVAAVGLVHFSPRGRLVEVCGDRVRRLYFKPYGDSSPEHVKRGKGDEPFETVAFFGLVREGETLWAAGIDGIYRLERGDVAFYAPLPTFKRVGGFHVSFALPRLVLVLTSVNQRRSISGSVPMLVPR